VNVLSDEYKFAKLKTDLAELILHWEKLATHVKQKPLPRKIIGDLAEELRRVAGRNQ
jgi:hypothetical protein